MLRPILARLGVYSSVSNGFLHTAAVLDRQERAEGED
jgi:hypothetical protein